MPSCETRALDWWLICVSAAGRICRRRRVSHRISIVETRLRRPSTVRHHRLLHGTRMLQTNSVPIHQLSVSVAINVHVMFARDVGMSVSQMATFCWSLERPQVANRDDESRKTKSLVVFVCVSKRYTVDDQYATAVDQHDLPCRQ